MAPKIIQFVSRPLDTVVEVVQQALKSNAQPHASGLPTLAGQVARHPKRTAQERRPPPKPAPQLSGRPIPTMSWAASMRAGFSLPAASGLPQDLQLAFVRCGMAKVLAAGQARPLHDPLSFAVVNALLGKASSDFVGVTRKDVAEIATWLSTALRKAIDELERAPAELASMPGDWPVEGKEAPAVNERLKPASLEHLPTELVRQIASYPGVAPKLGATSRTLRHDVADEAAAQLIQMRCEALMAPRLPGHPPGLEDLWDVLEPIGRQMMGYPHVPKPIHAMNLSSHRPLSSSQLKRESAPVTPNEIVELLGTPADLDGHGGGGAWGIADRHSRAETLESVQRLLEHAGVRDIHREPLKLIGPNALEPADVLDRLTHYTRVEANSDSVLGHPPDANGNGGTGVRGMIGSGRS